MLLQGRIPVQLLRRPNFSGGGKMRLSEAKQQKKKNESRRGSVIFIAAILSTVTLFALWNYSADVRHRRKESDRPPLFI
jgi:hypothetical protein